MTKRWMTVLALGLVAPAAFGQAAATAAHVKKAKAAGSHPAAAPVKVLRDEIKRDKGDMAGKTRAARAERKQLLVQERTELARAAQSAGTRAEKKQARTAVRAKYAQMLKDVRSRAARQRKNLSEDITSKRGQIKQLRQS